MGILHLTLVEERTKMKFISAACLVAAAFAEPEAKADADAALLYGAYGYGGHASPYALGYRGYAGYAGAYGAYPYARAYGGHYIGKRSADAEPEAEADAALLYGAYGYAGYAASPYTYGHAAYAGYPYAAGYAGAYGAYPYAGAYGAHYIGKRSADAEPEAEADAFYGAYGYSAYSAPHAYGYAASPYSYGYTGYSGYTGYPYAAHGAYAYGAYPYLG